MGAILNLRQSSRSKRRNKRGHRGGADPIEMRERRHNYFPKSFVWRGLRYDVDAVERCWTVSRRSRGGRVERHCFRVRCSFGPPQDRQRGTFEVYQDVRHNTWHIRRQMG
mgnify:CR=1 FL=1